MLPRKSFYLYLGQYLSLSGVLTLKDFVPVLSEKNVNKVNEIIGKNEIDAIDCSTLAWHSHACLSLNIFFLADFYTDHAYDCTATAPGHRSGMSPGD